MSFVRSSRLTVLVASIVTITVASAQTTTQPSTYGPELQGFDYPFPVQYFAVQSQRQTLQMAYLDVKPEQPNGRTVVLLHGKNFCAATWQDTIAALIERGYRVIAVDQAGNPSEPCNPVEITAP